MSLSAATRVLLNALLLVPFLAVSFGLKAQVHEQHPYRQIILRTKVKVESSRGKETKVRYSSWGNLTSSDRRYTQNVRLRTSVTNVSGADLSDIQVQYRIYKRDLAQNSYSVAASGELTVTQMKRNETKTLLTDEATCEYQLRWSKLVQGNRLRRSGEKYAGYVIIYCDKKGPVCWDISSQTVYSEYVKELRGAKKIQTGTSISPSEESSSLPYSAGAIVYVTRTGKKFHRESCRFVRTGARAISRAEALRLGYTACSTCKP